MRPLQTIERVLIWLCLLPTDKPISNWTKLSYFVLSVVVVTSNMVFLAASVVFFMKFYSTDLDGSFYALFQITGILPVNAMIIVSYCLRQKIETIFEKFGKIYAENANDETFDFLTKANTKCEWIVQIYLKFYMSGYFISMMLQTLVTALLNWTRNSNLDAEQLYHAYRITLPWDQTTPLGYVFETFFVHMFVQSYLILNGVILLLFVSMTLHHRAFYKMFNHSVNKLNSIDEERDDKRVLDNLIRFHVSCKQCFEISTDFYSPISFAQLTCSIISLACSILQLNMQIDQFDLNVTIQFLAETCIGLSNLFCFCYFGKMTSESFELMSECLYNCNWPDLSTKLKKYFIIMIQNGNTPVYYQGLKIFTLDMQSFREIVGMAFKYFMVFKAMTSD